MSHHHPTSSWSSHSTQWSQAVQAITRDPCLRLVNLANTLVPLTPSSAVLDNGAGSGQLTSVILSLFPSTPITAADISPGMIETLRATAAREHWSSVKPMVADASDLTGAGIADRTFTHSMGTFFLPFVADPARVLAQMCRVTIDGGVVAVSTWSRISWVSAWEAAVRETIDPAYTAPLLFHAQTTEPEDVRALMLAAGLTEVHVESVECVHPPRASVEAAVEEFWGMGNPSVQLLKGKLDEQQLAQVKPAFAKAYASKYDGVRTRQKEIAVLAVGRKKESG